MKKPQQKRKMRILLSISIRDKADTISMTLPISVRYYEVVTLRQTSSRTTMSPAVKNLTESGRYCMVVLSDK